MPGMGSSLMVDDSVAGGGVREYVLISCRHCQKQLTCPNIFQLQPDPMAYCETCNGYVCLDCQGEMHRTGRCLPWTTRARVESAGGGD